MDEDEILSTDPSQDDGEFFSLNLALVKMQTKVHEKVFCGSAGTVQTRCRRKVEALQRQIFLDKSPPCLKITHLNGEVN